MAKFRVMYAVSRLYSAKMPSSKVTLLRRM
jgi:hypothetical protein